MLPNPYYLDEMARLREEETRRMIKHAWVLREQRRVMVGWVGVVVMLVGVVVGVWG